MAFLSADDRAFLRTVSDLGYCNPFLRERIEFERMILGEDFIAGEPVWGLRVDAPEKPNLNVGQLTTRIETLIRSLQKRLARAVDVSEQDLLLYQDGVLFLLFHRYRFQFDDVITRALEQQRRRERCGFYTDFLHDWQEFFALPGRTLPVLSEVVHYFACFFQLRRAFYHIFQSIIGASLVSARLRAEVWQSIFTHDMRRYRHTLYDK
ncbi:MAG: hypothetical protein AB7P69_28785, partial [Candidatus Binatia bacterium]